MLEKLLQFKQYLIQQEKSKTTIEKYIRDIQKFITYLNNQTLNK